MKKISVVVPVYNAQLDHFKTMCESVLAQRGFEDDYEIIIVDDGSLPDKLHPIEDYLLDKPCFRLIKAEHVGVSEARNIALHEVTGNYLYFMDSDDYIEANAFQTIVKAFKDSSFDMIAFNWYTADRIFMKKKLHKSTYKECEIDQSSFVRSLLRGDRFMGYLWNKAINLDRIPRDSLPQFDRNVDICVDKLWLFEVAPLLERIRLLPASLYWYLDNPNSIQRKNIDVFKKENRVYHTLQTIVDKSMTLADGKYSSLAEEDYFNTLWFGMINWSWKYHSNKSARKENFDLLCSSYSMLKGRTGLQQHIKWKIASFPVVSRLFAGDLKRPNNSSCS